MRGKVAKKLRKKAYGDMSPKKKMYGLSRVMKRIIGGDGEVIKDRKGNPISVNRDTLVCKGERRAYKNSKKDYKDKR